MGAWCFSLAALLMMCIVVQYRSAFAEYQNFTVGDSEGWRPNPSLTYAKWASDKNFTLGDFLIFNFAKPEYNVIHTYNNTLYTTCDYMQSNGDFDVWGQPGNTTVSAIPLVETGLNYFFCGVNNSQLCKEGMKFGISVTEGDGLPPSLAIPPPALVNGTAPSQTTPSQPSSPRGDGNGSNGSSYMRSFTLSFSVVLLIPSFLAPLLLCL